MSRMETAMGKAPALAGRPDRITGPVPDQSALFAILTRLHTLNVTLIAVQRLPAARRQR